MGMRGTSEGIDYIEPFTCGHRQIVPFGRVAHTSDLRGIKRHLCRDCSRAAILARRGSRGVTLPRPFYSGNGSLALSVRH